MATAATIFQVIDHEERRRSTRRSINLPTTIRKAGAPHVALVHDLSQIGAKVETQAALDIDMVITIGIAGVGRYDARVMSRTGTLFGCEFLQPLAVGLDLAAFRADPIVPFPGIPPAEEATIPHARPTAPDKWPVAARIAVTGLVSLGLWGSIIFGARALFA